jgi:hypothetical protein
LRESFTIDRTLDDKSFSLSFDTEIPGLSVSSLKLMADE